MNHLSSGLVIQIGLYKITAFRLDKIKSKKSLTCFKLNRVYCPRCVIRLFTVCRYHGWLPTTVCRYLVGRRSSITTSIHAPKLKWWKTLKYYFKRIVQRLRYCCEEKIIQFRLGLNFCSFFPVLRSRGRSQK